MDGLKRAMGKNEYASSKIAHNISPSTSTSSHDHSRLLPPRQVVSMWTCSKLCAVCFVAGIVVGFTLKRRVRRWASRLLRRLKDD